MFGVQLAVTVACIDFLGLTVLGTSLADDGRSAAVDVCVRLKRRIDEAGKPVRRPPEVAWRERAHVVREADGDKGRWLVLDVQQLGDSSQAAATPAPASEASV